MKHTGKAQAIERGQNRPNERQHLEGRNQDRELWTTNQGPGPGPVIPWTAKDFSPGVFWAITLHHGAG